MAPLKLPCPVGGCDYETIQLEYAQAKEQLDIHVKYTHNAATSSVERDIARVRRIKL